MSLIPYRKRHAARPGSRVTRLIAPVLASSVVASSLAMTALLAPAHAATPAFPASGSPGTIYTPSTVGLDGVTGGPWTLSQGDPTAGTTYPLSDLYPTYTPSPADFVNGAPNVSVYPAANPTSTTTPPWSPYISGVAGSPGPLPALCTSGGPAPETGNLNTEPPGDYPMSPYYFPYIMRNADGSLTGYFDYRPKDAQEIMVVAKSTDNGQTWAYEGQALALNPTTNYCPNADSNDNGQGHPFTMTVGGQTNLYTLQRPAGDSLGVNLLVHQLATPSGANPLSGLPAVESPGVDPNTFATAGASLTTSTATTIPVTSIGAGTEQLMGTSFEDTRTGAVLTCTVQASPAALTACKANPATTVNVNDDIVQVLGTVAGSKTITIPAGPNYSVANGPGANGIASIGVTLNPADNPGVVSLWNANLPGRVYVNGSTVFCGTVNGSTTKLENCTTGLAGAASAPAGSPITTDPIVPATAQQTTGLQAPDGIVGSFPSSHNSTLAAALGKSIPPSASVIMYGEKILNYYVAGTLANNVSWTGSAQSVTVTASPTFSNLITGSGTHTIYIGATGGGISGDGAIETLTCTGVTSPSAGTEVFTGCTGAPAGAASASGYTVGGPGAAIAPENVLNSIGEGSTNPKTLFKNNEDYTVLRYAYTTDGINFTDLGVLSGTDSQTSPTGSYSDVNNPAAQAYPAFPNLNLPQGAADQPELRYVGTRGSIIANPDGSLTMFDSGAWQSDGDSDAFDQIFGATSTDGVHWSVPVVVETTDYTFSARQQQDAALAAGNDQPLAISGYYAGRTYSPTVVPGPNPGELTMVFSGYSTPKPLPADGSVLGDGANGTTPWKVSPEDPALYRNIMTVTLNGLTIDTTSLPNGSIGQPYSAPLAATGGTVPYTWDISAGLLPSGLSLNASTGVISGTPLTPGTSTFTVEVRDSSNPQLTATRQLSITVGGCTTTITGSHLGSLTLTGATCFSGATVTGSITIPKGAVVSIVDSTITGSISANGADTVAICGSTIHGAVSISNSTGFVLVGDDTGISSPACAGNTISGPVSLSRNSGGFEVGHNTITGSVSLSNNTGAGLVPGSPGPEVQENTIHGSLSCTGNNPPPSDGSGGRPNTVSGSASGQCSGLI